MKERRKEGRKERMKVGRKEVREAKRKWKDKKTTRNK